MNTKTQTNQVINTDNESDIPGAFQATLTPKTVTLLKEHFWCDFSDVFPSMTWDQNSLNS